MPARLSNLGRYDCVYLSPHAEEAAISCAGAILDDKGRGQRVLLLTLFGGDAEAVAREGPTARLGVEHRALGLPEAQRRDVYQYSFRSIFQGSLAPQDEDSIVKAAQWLAEVGRRATPRHVYAPLGVWGHVDHRVVHQAARRAFEGHLGRDLFFYEERPFSLLPSAVRNRLGQLGARLPPAVVSDGGGFTRFVLRFSWDPFVRRHFEGWWDGLQCTRIAARQWRQARTWRPTKAFGPRLQPVLRPLSAEVLALLRDGCQELPGGSPFGSPSRFERLMRGYARRLGQAGPVERYWLLLPGKDDGEGAFGALD